MFVTYFFSAANPDGGNSEDLFEVRNELIYFILNKVNQLSRGLDLQVSICAR